MTQITQFLRRAVQTNGKDVATVCGERTQSWHQFADRVARLAGALQELGYRPGDRIGILALNADRYLEAFFGLATAGVIFVPINTRLAPPEMVFWLADSGCTGLLIDDAFVPVLPAIAAGVPGLRHVVHIGDAPTPAGLLAYETLVSSAAPAADVGRGGSEIAGIFYTGGTTGRSKGVMLSHDNIVGNALNMLREVAVDTDAHYVHAAPMFHLADGAMTFLITAFGGTHCFLPRFDPLALMKLIAAQGVTHALLVPTMINMLVNHPDVARHDLSSLQYLLYGASPMPEAVIRRALEVLPKANFIQAYGQSEASPVLTLIPHKYHCFSGPFAGRLKSAGRAVIGCEVAVLDEEDREVPRGTVGEVCARGNIVMQGYWNQPALTAQTLRNGWLHTGDGGYMDEEGFIFIVDRVKDMIITGGENVYSAEVEEALYGHPAVAECAVIGVPDPQWGERVHAVVRCKPNTATTEDELIAHCRALIANYKLPRSVSFSADPLPLSGAGKILKTELRKPFWAGQDRQVS